MLKKTDKYVKFSTFNKWGVSNVTGFKTVEKEGTKFVNFVWCKIWAKHENRALDHDVRCANKDVVETFVNGRNVVTKFIVSMSFSKVVFKHALSRHIRKCFFLSAVNTLT